MRKIISIFAVVMMSVFITAARADDDDVCEVESAPSSVALANKPSVDLVREFYTGLVTDFIDKFDATDLSQLDEDFVVDYLTTGNNFERYRYVVMNETGLIQVSPEGFGAEVGEPVAMIDFCWSDVKAALAIALNENANARTGILMCENHRFGQAGVDIGITVVTAAAAFFGAGFGGAAVQSGVVIGKMALKTAARHAIAFLTINATKRAAKKTAAKIAGQAFKSLLTGIGKNVGKAMLTRSLLKITIQAGGKKLGRSVVKVGASFLIRRALAAVAASGMYVYQIDRKANALSTAISMIDSSINTSYVNCADTDIVGNGCYPVCGSSQSVDDAMINAVVFFPALRKRVCVGDKHSDEPYVVFEVRNDGTKIPLIMTDAETAKVKSYLTKDNIIDKGKCNMNRDDVDMYFGLYFYDPATFQINSNYMGLTDAKRIDHGFANFGWGENK